jgi:hypothetical protein
MDLRDTLLNAFRNHAQGHIDKHVANVEVYLANPAGIGEHSDIIEAMEIEVEAIAKYMDQIDVIERWFPLPEWEVHHDEDHDDDDDDHDDHDDD